MAVKCGSCVDVGVCDFCKYYAFNGEDWLDANGELWKGAIYVDKGKCEHPEHLRAAEPHDGCNDFHCSMAEVS